MKGIWQIIYSVVSYLVVEQQTVDLVTASLYVRGQGEVKLNFLLQGNQGSKVIISVTVVSFYLTVEKRSEKSLALKFICRRDTKPPNGPLTPLNSLVCLCLE